MKLQKKRKSNRFFLKKLPGILTTINYKNTCWWGISINNISYDCKGGEIQVNDLPVMLEKYQKATVRIYDFGYNDLISPLKLEGIIRWMNIRKRIKSCTIGIQFMGVTEDERQCLMSIMDQYEPLIV